MIKSYSFAVFHLSKPCLKVISYLFLPLFSDNNEQRDALSLGKSLLVDAHWMDIDQLIHSCYNLLAIFHVQLEDYGTAICHWSRMSQYCTVSEDQTYISHELGRCHFDLSHVSKCKLLSIIFVLVCDPSRTLNPCPYDIKVNLKTAYLSILHIF